MKKIIAFVLFWLCSVSLPVCANDSVFYAVGNTLIPLQETQVELRKEILKFYVVDHEFANVEIYFEFFNPGPQKKVTVGFVTPPAGGDVTEDEMKSPFITAFTVNVNGRSLAFQIKRLKETTFKVEKAEEDAPKDDYFVYYFPVTFKPGLNVIRHKYRYRGGSGVELDRDFDYQITTGKSWANKQIDDFELQLHLDTGVFFVPARFNAVPDDTLSGRGIGLADWKIVGDGVINPVPNRFFGEESSEQRLVHLNRGYLSFRERNFKPDFDLSFGEFNWGAGWVPYWCEMQAECVDGDSLEKVSRYFTLGVGSGYDAEEFKEFTPRDFKYLRNYIYALRGYDLRDPQLKKFYSQFFWYKPDKTLKIEDIKLTKGQRDLLRELKAIEAKKR